MFSARAPFPRDAREKMKKVGAASASRPWLRLYEMSLHPATRAPNAAIFFPSFFLSPHMRAVQYTHPAHTQIRSLARVRPRVRVVVTGIVSVLHRALQHKVS